jgi:branched-chain amino acid transport system permease protein
MSLIVIGGGIVDGFILALVALGFTVIYKATRVINFANGQMMVLGAYVSWYGTTRLGLPFVVCLVAGVGSGVAVGAVADRIFMAPVRRASLFTQVMVLFALASIMDGTLVQVFGATTQNVAAYAPTNTIVPGFGWSWLDLVIMGTVTVVTVLLLLFFYTSDRGLDIRAAADNRAGAALVGINANTVALQAWMLGGGLTALAGVLVIPKLTLDVSVGDSITFLAFAAVVLGGLGSIWGAIVGGLVISIAQVLVASYFTAGYEPLVSLVVMLGVLTVKPTGLAGDAAE